MGSVGKDSPVGQVITSVYSYALSETMGFGVDYNKTLQAQHDDHLKSKGITEAKIDSLCEKIESAVAEMHRPIVASKTANRAQVSRCDHKKSDVGPILSSLKFDYVRQTIKEEKEISVKGYITSYNVNTYKGRIFTLSEDRPIPFDLLDSAKSKNSVGKITRSQHRHGQNPFSADAEIEMTVCRIVSITGTTKRYLVSAIN